jgi:Fe-S-cluster containining protein
MQARNNIEHGSLSDNSFVLIENTNQQDAGITDYAHRPIWNFEVGTSSKTTSMTLIANHNEATLSDLVPIAHQVCDKINQLAIESEIEKGGGIACKKGCASCCSYMVSVSSAEAFYLQKQILLMSGERRRSILHSFLKAARMIAANKVPPTCNPKASESETLKAISKWYQKLNIKCPFLEDNACSEYNSRPLACREHLVTSPPKACYPSSGMLASSLELPISTAETLMHISNSVESTIDEAVVLPLAMVWCNSNTERAEKKYSTTLLAEQLINEVSIKTPALS